MLAAAGRRGVSVQRAPAGARVDHGAAPAGARLHTPELRVLLGRARRGSVRLARRRRGRPSERASWPGPAAAREGRRRVRSSRGSPSPQRPRRIPLSLSFSPSDGVAASLTLLLLAALLPPRGFGTAHSLVESSGRASRRRRVPSGCGLAPGGPLAPGSGPRSGGVAEAASPEVPERTGAAEVPTPRASCPTPLRRRRTSRPARQWSSRGWGGSGGHAPLPLPRVRRRGVDLGRRSHQGGNADASAKGEGSGAYLSACGGEGVRG
ncbi:unnamed protein product [Urochloa humidicola]